MNIDKSNIITFAEKLVKSKTKLNEPIAPYTGLKIGGPADILYTAEGSEDLKKVFQLAKDAKIPVTLLGGGSNILVSDNGIRGLVVVLTKGDITIGEEIDADSVEKNSDKEIDLTFRWESDTSKGTFRGIEFKDLDYDESHLPKVVVKMDAGVSLQYALAFLIERGITGLQWYAGIPGTIGGAVFNNIHGGTHFIGELIKSVEVLDQEGNLKTLEIADLGAGYDRSRFHKSKEIILSATFNMYKGDKEKAKYVAQEWAKRKRIQPRNSPGCAFGNITQLQKEKLNYPTTSIGYIVEHVINLADLKIGDAMISPDHHNFIINLGNATAKDYLAVVKTIHRKTLEMTGIELVPEIFFLGFDPEEISEFSTHEQQALREKRHSEIRSVYKKK
jgi:UDP-N-acetylmuramate dehydrogenase